MNNFYSQILYSLGWSALGLQVSYYIKYLNRYPILFGIAIVSINIYICSNNTYLLFNNYYLLF